MKFAISGNTDVGIKKSTNQDSLFLRKYLTSFGEVVLIVLCDGMGGLEKGEVASASLINAFEKWADENHITLDPYNLDTDEEIMYNRFGYNLFHFKIPFLNILTDC